MNPYTRWKHDTTARLAENSVIAQTARGPVEYATRGHGPAVLMSHGTPGGYDGGLVMAELLDAPQLRFIAPSRPGYLRTPLETGATPEEQADAFAALLITLHIPNAAIVGVSGGGPAALQFALRHPARCRAVVLVSAITRRRPAVARSLGWWIFHHFLVRSDFIGWLGSIPLRRPPARAIMMSPEEQRRKALLRRFLQTNAPYSLRSVGHRNDAAQFEQLPEYPLERIKQPTFIIHGTGDRAVPFAHAESAAGAIGGARLLHVADGGHGCVFDTPEPPREAAAFLAAHQ